jgi:hypothetical protein
MAHSDRGRYVTQKTMPVRPSAFDQSCAPGRRHQPHEAGGHERHQRGQHPRAVQVNNAHVLAERGLLRPEHGQHCQPEQEQDEPQEGGFESGHFPIVPENPGPL